LLDPAADVRANSVLPALLAQYVRAERHDLLSKWRTNCIALLEPWREGSKLTERIDHISQARAREEDLKTCVGILQNLRQTIEEGFLDDLSLKVESEIAADYMGQAEQLLKEGQPGKFDYVPAAVLSGAALEKGLRTLCGQQQPPVLITDAKGAPKTPVHRVGHIAEHIGPFAFLHLALCLNDPGPRNGRH
jgi:hypothetical protein